MDVTAAVISAVAGLLAGWYVVVPVVERIPEPSPLEQRARIAVMIVNAVLWFAAARQFSRPMVAIVYFLVFSTLLAVSVVDLRIYRIPDRIVFPALGAALVLVVTTSYVIAATNSNAIDIIERALLGMVTYFGILFIFHLISPRGMGFGDVKLALLMGLALGWVGTTLFEAVYFVMIALFLACILGIVFGLTVRFVRKQGGAFPFGPALALATVYIVLVV